MGMTAPEQLYRTAVLRLHPEISRQWNTYAIDHSEIANWAGLNAYMSVHYGPLDRSAQARTQFENTPHGALNSKCLSAVC